MVLKRCTLLASLLCAVAAEPDTCAKFGDPGCTAVEEPDDSVLVQRTFRTASRGRLTQPAEQADTAAAQTQPTPLSLSHATSVKECDHRPKNLFCFSMVRSPPEKTAALLAKQLDVACDGWRLFGDRDDPENNITKGWSKQDMPSALAHQMRGVITKGIWKNLVESGFLDEYEWFLMIETDSFVRPSTLRKTFQALSTTCERRVFSIMDHYLDGFFLAWQASTVMRMKSLGWPRACDMVLSGHKGWQSKHFDENKNLNRCLRSINVARIEGLLDRRGHRLLADDQDDDSDEPVTRGEVLGPKSCGNIAEMLVKRATRKIKGPLCDCATVKYRKPRKPWCLSEEFVSVHHVKSAKTYAKLVKAFP